MIAIFSILTCVIPSRSVKLTMLIKFTAPCITTLLWFASVAFAAVEENQAARLGGDELTPLGAERAGNIEGTIPAWTGGLDSSKLPISPGKFLADPYPEDKILFTITAENLDQYADQLSEGQMALIRNNPDSWRMNVYPSRRSSSYPEFVYQAVQHNATRSAVDMSNLGGVVDADISSPFPVPSQGVEVIWNHNLRWRGVAVDRYEGLAAPTRGTGNFSLIVFEDQVAFPFGAPAEAFAKKRRFPQISIALKSKVIAPGFSTGSAQLVLESSNYNQGARRTWVYNQNLRRIFRTPFSGFDNPVPLSDGLRFNDETDMYNGSPALFHWKLLGKREMYIPYNAFRLHGGELTAKDIVESEHISPNRARYELHRVWVVEGTVKEATRRPLRGVANRGHSYSKRVFYVDEDSWSIVLADNYDSEGNLWRFSEGHLINYYSVPVPWYTLQTSYDFKQQRYLVTGLDNQLEPYKFKTTINVNEFSPNALDYYVR
jgi:hypothetical protein